MKISTKTEIIHRVNYEDLNDAVKHEYNQIYQCVADMEWQNDSTYQFNIKKERISGYSLDSIEYFKKTGKYNFILRSLLIDMCNKNLIPEGNYIIKVGW